MRIFSLILGLGLWGTSAVRADDLDAITLNIFITAEPLPKGPLIAILTNSSRAMSGKQPDGDKPFDLANAPLVVSLGQAEAKKVSTVRVPSGSYQMSAFVSIASKGCKDAKSDPEPDPGCFPVAGDANCSSGAVDTAKTKTVEIYCGTPVKR